MDPVTVGLATNLLAAGLTKGAAGSLRIWEDTLRKNEFSTAIDAVETEFNCSLKSAIEEVDTECETVELSGVEENWDEIVVELYGLDDTTEIEEELPSERLVFDSEEDAVEKIARTIANADGVDLDENPQLERELKRVVSEAYREAVDSFGDRIVEAGLAQEFVVETNIEEIEELDRLQDRIEELEQRFTQPKFYDLFTGDEEGRRRASKRIEPQALEFVSRPELEERGERDRLLLLGPGGSGKSRALAELVATYDQDVQHVIVPRAPLQSPQDLQPLRNESFEGDVLLVWDDIHSISPETDNTVFRKAIDELEDILDDDLHVLAAARSNHVESLPGDVQKTGSPLWSAFETIELAEFGEEEIEVLFDRVLAKEDMEISEKVREKFVWKTLRTDTSPLYVISVVETAEGERLTTNDIETLPEDALAIWEDQYADIKAANDERRFVLWAVKLLSEVGMPYYHSLLKGIYTHVLNRDELMFEPPVKELCQRQWLIENENTNYLLITADNEKYVTKYTIHDVKFEAIDESIERLLHDISAFLLEKLDEYLPIGEHNAELILHRDFGYSLKEHTIQQNTQLAAKHYERALALNPDCAIINTNLENSPLAGFDTPEEAKDHYERALDCVPGYDMLRYNYANLLYMEFDALEEVRNHFQLVLWHWQDASISEYVLSARYSLIRVCRALDDKDAAIEHCEHAIDLIADTDLDDESPLWFESVHAILTDMDSQTRYACALTNISENDFELATELFEMIWIKRDDHPPDSDTHQLALSAGIALAANIQLHDDFDVFHTCDEILNTIDPEQLTTPAATVYDFLDTGTTTTTPDDLRARATEKDEEMTVDTLEPPAFAELLERLENE
jgi:tetratricopeptide (TPR) repeat protein